MYLFISLRITIFQFYAYWGYDLDSQSTPYECGRAFRVRMEDKNNINSQLDFIGKDAFLKQKRVCVFSFISSYLS